MNLLAGLSIDKVHYCYMDEENLQVIDVKIYTYKGSGRGGLPPPTPSVESARRCLCFN